MIKFGVEFPQEGHGYEAIEGLALECERLGLDSFWVNDHFFFSEKPYLESWTVLTALAAKTERLRLGPLVVSNSYRHPSLLAKMASTLDVVSRGRLELGVGAGWHKREYTAYGIPFPEAKVRIQQMEEGIQVMKKMWTEERASFRGKYYTIQDAVCNPKPVQRPHPPITVGGSGKMVLKAVARHADGCNFQLTPEEYKGRLELLKRYCAAIGRDYGSIEKSLSAVIALGEDKREVEALLDEMRKSGRQWFRYLLGSPDHLRMALREPRRALSYLGGRVLGVSKPTSAIVGTPEECVERMEEYARLGVTSFILHFPTVDSSKGLHLLAHEVIPALR